MPIIPLYGHESLAARLLDLGRSGVLPQSLLLHGPAGVGKQRIALAIGQTLLCSEAHAPCGRCRHCRFVLELSHPDLLWVFPRPRPKDTDPKVEDVALDLAGERQARAKAHGLYAAPPSNEAIFISTVRLLVQHAGRTPAIAARKVFIVGDADRMVQQEGAEFAANAFLKLLEEPLADTWVIVTTSAVSSLLPTIRSRLIAVRVPILDESSVRAFVADERVRAALDKLRVPSSIDERVALSHGAPGRLLSSMAVADSVADARRLLDAAVSGDRAKLLRLAFGRGHSGARGAFSDVLEALTVALHERMRDQALGRDETGALASSRAVDFVEEAKRLAEGNVSPQLISARLLGDLAATLAQVER